MLPTIVTFSAFFNVTTNDLVYVSKTYVIDLNAPGVWPSGFSKIQLRFAGGTEKQAKHSFVYVKVGGGVSSENVSVAVKGYNWIPQPGTTIIAVG